MTALKPLKPTDDNDHKVYVRRRWWCSTTAPATPAHHTNFCLCICVVYISEYHESMSIPAVLDEILCVVVVSSVWCRYWCTTKHTSRSNAHTHFLFLSLSLARGMYLSLPLSMYRLVYSRAVAQIVKRKTVPKHHQHHQQQEKLFLQPHNSILQETHKQNKKDNRNKALTHTNAAAAPCIL